MSRFKDKLVSLFKSLSPADHVAALLLILTTIHSVDVTLQQGWKSGIKVFSGAIFLVALALLLFWPLKQWLSRRKKPVHVVISALMLFLVLNHSGHQVLTVVLLFTGLFWAKFGLKVKGKMLFNPVAFSIAFVTVLSILFPVVKDPGLEWTGILAKFQWFGIWIPLPLLFLTLSIFTNARRVKRIPLALSYILVVLSLQLLLGGIKTLTAVLPAALFMGALVVLEPKTSPVRTRQQILYGVVSGSLFMLFLTLSVPSAAMMALCVSNLGYWLCRIWGTKPRAKMSPSPA